MEARRPKNLDNLLPKTKVLKVNQGTVTNSQTSLSIPRKDRDIYEGRPHLEKKFIGGIWGYGKSKKSSKGALSTNGMNSRVGSPNRAVILSQTSFRNGQDSLSPPSKTVNHQYNLLKTSTEQARTQNQSPNLTAKIRSPTELPHHKV